MISAFWQPLLSPGYGSICIHGLTPLLLLVFYHLSCEQATVFFQSFKRASMIQGAGNEDASLTEGTVTYDIRFLATAPVSGELTAAIRS